MTTASDGLRRACPFSAVGESIRLHGSNQAPAGRGLSDQGNSKVLIFTHYTVFVSFTDVQDRGTENHRRISVGPPFSGKLLQAFYMQRYALPSRSTLLVVSVLATSLLLGGKSQAQLIN